MNQILGYTRHPASACWPDLDDDTTAGLAESIREQGQADPIEATPDGRVFDGWQRLRAIERLADVGEQVVPTVVICHFSDEEIFQRIRGKHDHRRHVGKKERADMMLATALACGIPLADRGDRRAPDQTAQNDQSAPMTAERLAQDAGVSTATARRSIQDHKREQGLLDQPDAQEGDGMEIPAFLDRRDKAQQPDPEAEAERIRRTAEAAAKRAARPKPLEEQLSFWKESNEVLSAELAEARARLAEVAADLDEEISDEDANAEFKRAMAELRKANDRLHNENNQLRERVEEAESQVVHFRTYASEIEAALQNRDE